MSESKQSTLVYIYAGERSPERKYPPENVQALVNEGMIERVTHPRNGRACVQCTPAGKAAAKATGRVSDLW